MFIDLFRVRRRATVTRKWTDAPACTPLKSHIIHEIQLVRQSPVHHRWADAKAEHSKLTEPVNITFFALKPAPLITTHSFKYTKHTTPLRFIKACSIIISGPLHQLDQKIIEPAGGRPPVAPMLRLMLQHYTGDEGERAVVFGCLASLGAALCVVGVPAVKAVLLCILVSTRPRGPP
jgi:hypothetical protein